MKTLQRTSQCQRNHCCLLADREHLPLLIHQLLLRHGLRSCLLRLLLRHLLRLCLLRLLLMHLLKVRLQRHPKRPDSVTSHLNNRCSRSHTSNLHSILQHSLHRRAHRLHCQTRQQRLHRRNQRQRSRNSKMMMRTRIWIHSIRWNQPILLYYPFPINNLLLHWILRPADRAVDPIAKPQRRQLLLTQNKVMIRHVRLEEGPSVPEPPADPPQAASRSSSAAPTEFYSDIAKAHGRVHSQLGDSQDFMFWNMMGNVILYFGWTTLKRRPPTTHLM